MWLRCGARCSIIDPKIKDLWWPFMVLEEPELNATMDKVSHYLWYVRGLIECIRGALSLYVYYNHRIERSDVAVMMFLFFWQGRLCTSLPLTYPHHKKVKSVQAFNPVLKHYYYKFFPYLSLAPTSPARWYNHYNEVNKEKIKENFKFSGLELKPLGK